MSEKGSVAELVGAVGLFLLGSGALYIYVKFGEWWVEGFSGFLRDHILLR